jgi:small subunit ribosomal protein S8
MSMTDPIADMLTRIRNAAQARHEDVEVPWSRMKESIARVFVDEGYVHEVRRVNPRNRVGEVLRIHLKFDKDRNSIITGLKRVSRPGRRVYVGYQEIPPVRKGLGVNVLSTPKGILADRQAQRAKVGGELVCSVW